MDHVTDPQRTQPEEAGRPTAGQDLDGALPAHIGRYRLELLPGPRDREGLPDSIRFWKDRLEESDAENTFAVGLLSGPPEGDRSYVVGFRPARTFR